MNCNELFFVWKNGLGHDSEDLSVCPEHWERCVSPVEPPCGMCGHAPAFQPGQLETAESPLKNAPKNSSPHPTVPLHVGRTGKKPLKGATTNFQFWKFSGINVLCNRPSQCRFLSVYMRLPVIF